MTVKIFKTVFATAFAILAAAVIAVFAFDRAKYSESVWRELEEKADEIAAEVSDGAALEEIDAGGFGVTLVRSGDVVFDNTGAVGGLLELPEMQAASAEGAGRASRYSSEEGKSFAYYARSLDGGWLVRVRTEYRGGASAFGDMLPLLLGLFVGTLLLAFVAAGALSAAIVRPISGLDLEATDEASVFEELRPLMRKISSQNYKIAKQRSELALKKNEFNSITANMSEGLVLINSRGAVVSCNNSAHRIFEVGDELPASATALNPTPSFKAAVFSALTGKNAYEEMRKNDKYYSLIISPVLHNSVADGAVIVAIDETEKEAREALRREFTSNISHELKTPLTSISGFSELIAAGVTSREEASDFAKKIHTEATRLIDLVGDIIRLTQLDGGEIPYDDEEIDLLCIAGDVAARLANVAERAGVTVSVGGEHLFVRGNSTILFEMIYNLADNGIKYNGRGGSVALRVFGDGGFVALSVKDDGIGIPSDKQDRVFERFYRVDKSHSKEIGGTGLGLSIVKHAAAYHNAKIELASEVGVGTEICVRFSGDANKTAAGVNNQRMPL